MSEARGRKAQDSAEKPDNAQTIKEGYGAGAGAAGAAVGAALLGYGVASEKTRNKLDREMRADERKFRRAEMASRRRARALDKQMDSDKRTARRLEKSIRGGGGGGMPTTTGLVGKAVEKFFKKT